MCGEGEGSDMNTGLPWSPLQLSQIRWLLSSIDPGERMTGPPKVPYFPRTPKLWWGDAVTRVGEICRHISPQGELEVYPYAGKWLKYVVLRPLILHCPTKVKWTDRSWCAVLTFYFVLVSWKRSGSEYFCIELWSVGILWNHLLSCSDYTSSSAFPFWLSVTCAFSFERKIITNT